MVLFVAALGIIVAAAYTFTRTPLYSSQAVIEPQGVSQSSGSGPTLYDKSIGSLPNQLEIFSTSRSLAETFRKRMNLEEYPELKLRHQSWFDMAKDWVSQFTFLVRDQPQEGEKQRDVAAFGDRFPVRAEAKSSKKSGLITVSMTAESPRLAQKMLQVYLEVFLERNLENRRAESLEAADWLKTELDEVNRKLIETQANLVAFTIENGIVDSRDGGIGAVMSIVNRTLEKRVRTEEQQAQLSLLEQEAKNKDTSAMLPASGKAEYIGKLKSDVAHMESEYTQMSTVYSENYPKLALMRKKIQFLKDRIHSMEKESISAAKDFAEKEQQAVQESFKAASKEASRVQVLEAEYLTLKKEVDANLEFQKLLLKEYKQMHIKARTIGNNLRMIDPPTLPTAPSWPKKGLFLLIGAAIGLGGGIAAAFVADAFDDSVKDHTEIEREFGVRKLGAVPDVKKLAAIHKLDEEFTDFEFVAHDKPKSPMSDAIRNVQTSLVLSNMEDPVRSMCVSSSVPAEGKTFISVSLATMFCTTVARRVLLVDGDLRKPRVHKALGHEESGLGLADVLNGMKTPLDDVIRPHRIPGFFYITAGTVPNDPISLITGDRMQVLMDELHERFDYIVVDTPPILGFSDTPILSTYVEGLVLVIQPGKASKGQVREAVKAVLSVDGTRLLGAVMNKADVIAGYGYKYRYGGYLRYGLYGGYSRYGGYGGYQYANYQYYSDQGPDKRSG